LNGVALAALVILVFLFLKIPVFVALLSGSIVYFVTNPQIPPLIFAQRVSSGSVSVTLLAVPFFVAAGVFMNYSGVTRRVMDFCALITGRMIGGLAQVNILLSTLMGGLSGSALADAAMEAKMLVPEMERQGYSKEFSSVITAASSMITPLIPPGIAMILYGSIANVSIGRLFVSGIGVGLVLCISMMFLTRQISVKRAYIPLRKEKLPLKDSLKIIREALLPLCLPVIIIGGIRLGIFTPTEAGSVAIVYALILGFSYGEMDLKKFLTGIKETVITTSSIMLIVAAASAFAWVLTKERIPQRLTEFIVGTISNKYVFLLVINIFLIIVGMFIEGNAAMIVLVPLLAPVGAAYGYNEIHFAMVFIFNMAIGSLSPPMGTLMFVTCGITGCGFKSFIKEAVPYYIMLVVVLFLLSAFPVLTTGLVSLIY
jgi:tripartite ATP-independent transporter DctM subunit